MMFTVFFPEMLELILEFREGPDDYTPEEYVTYAQGTTVYYWTLVCGQIAAALSTTTVTESLLTYGIPNHTLTVFILGEIALSLFLIYYGPVASMLSMYPLPQDLLLLPVLVAFLPIVVVEEARKWWVRSR